MFSYKFLYISFVFILFLSLFYFTHFGSNFPDFFSDTFKLALNIRTSIFSDVLYWKLMNKKSLSKCVTFFQIESVLAGVKCMSTHFHSETLDIFNIHFFNGLSSKLRLGWATNKFHNLVHFNLFFVGHQYDTSSYARSRRWAINLQKKNKLIIRMKKKKSTNKK